MKITTPDWRTRILTKDDGTELGRIRRVSWFGHTAEVLTGGQIYVLKTYSFRHKLTLFFNESPVLEIGFPWRKGVVLENKVDPNASFTAKQVSIWRHTYEVKDKNDQVIASFRTPVNWRKLRHEVELQAADEVVNICPPWILLSAVHAVLVQQSRRAAAAS